MKNLFDSFNKLNDQGRYGVLVGFVFLILLLDVFFLILPQMAAIDNINGQIKQLSDDTQQAVDSRGRINVLKKTLQSSRLQVGSLSNRVRTVQEVPAILSAVSSIANEYGVKIDELVPEKKQQELLQTAADGKYYALPVEIKARCGYHAFGRFLNKMEKGNFYFIMKDFIVQNDEQDVHAHLFSLTINMILVDRTPGPAKNL